MIETTIQTLTSIPNFYYIITEVIGIFIRLMIFFKDHNNIILVYNT